MDKNCKIVQDLIPLCAEKTASDESVTFVKEHCKTCQTCKKIYEFSGINLTKKEKEQDDKMQKIWKNIERQETAKKRKKVIISGICGCLAGILIFLYLFSCFHGTVWAIGYQYNYASEDSMKYFSRFELYEPGQDDIDAAADALKEHFKENNHGEILTNLVYDEYKTYDTNSENNNSEKSIVFIASIINFTDIPKYLITNTSSSYKCEVSYNTKTELWETAFISGTTTVR